MSLEFFVYIILFVASACTSVLIIGPERIISVYRLIGLFWLTFVITYLVRPTLSQISGDMRAYLLYRTSTFEENPLPPTVAIVLALLVMSIGYRHAIHPSVDAIRSVPACIPTRNYPKAMYFVIGLLLLYGYSSLFLARGVGTMEETPGGSVFIDTSGYAILGDYMIGPTLVTLYAISGNLVLPMLIALPWITNRIMIGWSRHLILIFGLAMFFVWLWKVRRRQQLILIMLVILVGFAIMPLINKDRYYFSTENLDMSEVITALFSQESVDEMTGNTSPITGFEQTVVIVNNPREFMFGLPYLYSYLLQPIPRIMWPGKPTGAEDIKQRLKSLFGMQTNLDANQLGWRGTNAEWYGSVFGSVGEAFVQLGWIGIVVIFYINGLLIGWFEHWFAQSNKSPSRLMAYAGLFGMLPLTGRVNLLGVLQTWIIYYGIIFLVVRWVENQYDRNQADV